MLSLNANNKISIFSPSFEKINLYSAVILFVPVIYISFRYPWLGVESDLIIRIIVYYLLGNFTHTFFTYFLLLKIPEFKQLAVQSFREDRVWPKVAVIFSVSLFLLGALKVIYGPEHSIVYFGFILISPLAAIHHISQVRGMSVMYDRAADFDKESTDRSMYVDKNRKWQSNLFKILTITMALFVPLKQIDSKIIPNIDYIFLSFTALICLVIFVLAVQEPTHKVSNKSTFLLRLFYFPFVMISPIALAANRALHGIEYICVIFKISDESLGKQSRHQLFIWTLSVVLPLCIFTLPRNLWGFVTPHELKDVLTLPLTAIIFGLATLDDYLHFYLDGIIFRMRDERVRNAVGHLLVKKQSTYA